MDKKLRTEYFTDFFNSAKENGYSFVSNQSLKETKVISKNHNVYFHMRPLPSDHMFYGYKPIDDLYYFLKIVKNKNPDMLVVDKKKDKDTLTFEIFIKNCVKNPKLINYFSELTGKSLSIYFDDVFPQVFPKKSLIENIKEINDNFLLSESGLKNFDSYLKHNKFSDEEIKLIFFSYFEIRKNKLENPTFLNDAKVFILEKWRFDIEFINSLSFMPFLKYHLGEEINDIFFRKKFNIACHIEYKKLQENIMIGPLTKQDYLSIITNFSNFYFKQYHIDKTVIDSSEKFISIFVSHNNNDLTQNDFEQKLILFLREIKGLESPRNISEEQIKKWLFKESLKSNLKEKAIEKTIKI